MDPARAARLNKLLDQVMQGKQPVNSQNKSLFIEAICAQADHANWLGKIITSKSGIDAIQASMRFELTPAFFNGGATALLTYFQAPVLKDIGGGELLNQVIRKIVEPPIFWASFSQSFRTHQLQKDGELCFAWVLHRLVSLPSSAAAQYREQASADLEIVLASADINVRTLGQKIKLVLDAFRTGSVAAGEQGPGGRHDNDFPDFRDIAILPTADEITSSEPPFLRDSATLEDLYTEATSLATHLDNQFRLLREDMLYEMREELQIAFGKKKGYHRGLVINGLELQDVYFGPDDRRCKWGITLKCKQDLPQFKDTKDRRKFLMDNRNFLRHQSITCLVVGGEVVAFPAINRDEALLAQEPPVLALQLEGEASTTKALLKLKMVEGDAVKLIQIDTAIFSYEPVLNALQQTINMPLSPELLLWKENNILSEVASQPTRIVQALWDNPRQDLQPLLQTSAKIILDTSQAASLASGLTQRVSLIQGPPGTGKSFIGALIAKSLHNFTEQRILVVCYTNHALDDILTSLLDIGIPEASMVRLGGKSTQRTEPLMLQKQNSSFRMDKSGWSVIHDLRNLAKLHQETMQASFERYISASIRHRDLMGHLEFEDPAYYAAFQVPQSEDGSTRVGRGGRAVDDLYLLDRWVMGWDAGTFKHEKHVQEAGEIWTMPPKSRETRMTKWKSTILREQVDQIYADAKAYNECQDQIGRQWAGRDTEILRNKRIIGCTTTAAAKYRDNLQAASIDVLLVEEAGEILESHVLTALGPQTTQLIMIGDHKQLRPKVNNYQLTVEKGEGYDLNRSLFERLILKGYPHEKLTEQHRMRPEISALIRALTYPELVDAPKTKNRPNIRGIQDNTVFINHEYPEDEFLRLADKRDGAATSSKQNSFEVEMVLKIVRYLAQQGYGTDALVILTPYLGQLQQLQAALRKDNDPILNDMDSYDLVRAGLLPPATAKLSRRPIRLATIDNYQGEESDIVIISLTRSNPNCDIGFMFSPERLNVLLSRARNAFVMLGNAQTFMSARKGKDIWRTLFGLLKDGKHIYDGLPVQCERHSSRVSVLKNPDDFDTYCPDGGCTEPCGTMLNCGVHSCPSKCHQLYDHSKMQCTYIVSDRCSNGHERSWNCHKGFPATCTRCERATKLAEKKRLREFAIQEKRDAELATHAKAMAALDEQIEQQMRAMQDDRLADEREAALRQKAADLVAAKSLASRARALPAQLNNKNTEQVSGSSDPNSKSYFSKIYDLISPGQSKASTSPSSISSTTQSPRPPPSKSEVEWERHKNTSGESDETIDRIMAMIGLEHVKDQVLVIKAGIDTKKRQNASFKQERFNIVLQGNPGTGKTTVARLYAKFLAFYGVLPGNAFIETTGSRLANDGVDGIKKHIEEVINAGGGAIFVDEAYQLTSQHNSQGGPVLDFLLAEMENNIGTIVFILAGYNKEMEKFFEHNPGLQSRVPFQLQFSDYTDEELLQMMEASITRRFQGTRTMEIEGGSRGLFARIAIQRLGRGRGTEGFGNARALENRLDFIFRRQAKRLTEERRDGRTPDDFVLCKEDIIGPDPSQAILKISAWEKLQELIGLKIVKESVTNLISLLDTNYQRELHEQKPLEFSLNRVFLGSPGTGKTTVARFYGEILADLGLLSNGEVVMKNPADFIGAVIGESEKKTKAILANTVGKVLVIDEAYMLYSGGGDVGTNTNQFKTAVIDTIVAEVQSVPGEDRCVLLLGYKDQIVDMFQNVNPGLSRRFAIEDAFHFEDFSNQELGQILDLKLKAQDLSATAHAKTVALEVLDRARNRPNFGNAGEVENLLGQAKNRYQARQASVPVDKRSFNIVFEPQDFDANFNRDTHASTNLTKLFEDIVGCDEIVARMDKYQNLARALKARNKSTLESIPTNFVFKGPPGTGKTTIARKMGQVYYDMGFLSSWEVIECSASDLVGSYVGHTGPKTKKLFEKALGRVLFIDEAYRLSEGHFAKEAIDEVVGLLTHPKFKHKLIVILAGYDQDMNKLMAVNSGLASRFPVHIPFHNMQPKHCLEVLDRDLKKNDVLLPDLSDLTSVGYNQMAAIIADLSRLPSWGNARDMLTLSKEMIAIAFLANTDAASQLTLSTGEAIKCMNSMLSSQQTGGRIPRTDPNRTPTEDLPQQDAPPPLAPVPPPAASTSQTEKAPPHVQRRKENQQQVRIPQPPPSSQLSAQSSSRKTKAPQVEEYKPVLAIQSGGRDAGVTDEVWNRLQACKKAEEELVKKIKEDFKRLEREKQAHDKRLREQRALAKTLAEAVARDERHRQEIKRQQEEVRLKELAAREAQRRAAAALEAKRKQEEARKAKEEAAQAALRRMGVCVAGYRWISVGFGYRCAGGSHFVSNAQLNA